MKKLLSFTIAAIMVVMAGCGAPAAAPSSSVSTPDSQTPASPASPASVAVEPTAITIWQECDATIAGEIQKELDKLAPEIVVKVERKEKMADALKLVGNDPKSAPDMYFFAHDKIGVFAEMGILAPTTDFISKDEYADLLPMAASAATYKDNIYQLPIYFETLLFMYNKALMKEPPKTTDDLLAYMKANTKDGMYGFAEMHSTAYYSVCWTHGFGGFVINDKSEPGLNSKETIDSLNYHKQFVPLMPQDGEYNTVTTMFREGKAHATIGGPWLVPDLKSAGIDLGIAPMPTINSSGKPLTPFSGVQGVCVLKHATAKKDAVAKVLRQLLLPDIGVTLAKTANSAPVNTKCYNDAAVSGNEMIAMMKATAENVVPMPNVPEMDVMWSVTENMLSAVNKNGADPAQAAEMAQKEALEQIAAMK